jgi:hypothetical protein
MASCPDVTSTVHFSIRGARVVRRSEIIGHARERIAYIMAFAPNSFPQHEGLPTSERMTLELAFAKLDDELGRVKSLAGIDEERLEACCSAVRESWDKYRSGDPDAGVVAIQVAYHILRKLK